MKIITLSRGESALVDDEDYESLSQFKWHARKGGNTSYAARYVSEQTSTGRKERVVLMHNVVMNITDFTNGMLDHKNGNGLDNQKTNLRMSTMSQNARNAPKAKLYRGQEPTSKFKGVYRRPNGRWYAQARINKMRRHIGSFADEREAARAYDAVALREAGEFAYLNFPPEGAR